MRVLKMKVKALMRLKPKTVFPSTPLSSVWKTIACERLYILPVVDDKKIIKGIISAEDLLIRLIPDYREFFSAFYPDSPEIEDIEEKMQKQITLLAQDVMNKEVYTVNQDHDVFKALSRMITYNVTNLPAVDGKYRLRGIIAEEDIFNYLFTKKESIFLRLDKKVAKEKERGNKKKEARLRLTRFASALKKKPSKYLKFFQKKSQK